MRTSSKFILCLLLVLCCHLLPTASFGQQKAESYLLVWFERNYDKVSRRGYVTLKAERGCDSAGRVYSLIDYDPKDWTPNEDRKFFHLNRSAGDSLYNYFLSPTEGLNFLSSLGWRLAAAFPQTTSGSTNERAGSDFVPVTTVTSHPVFCFKK